MTTTRTPEILAVKTCPDKAGQPGSGKVDAYVLGHITGKTFTTTIMSKMPGA